MMETDYSPKRSGRWRQHSRRRSDGENAAGLIDPMVYGLQQDSRRPGQPSLMHQV